MSDRPGWLLCRVPRARAFCLAVALGMLLGVTAARASQLVRSSEVGPVKATVTIAPEEPTIGDEVVLEIQVEAAKDVEVLMPEFGEALDRYTILDFVPKQHIAADGQQVLSQRYTLQPSLSGAQSIPSILIEFVDHRAGMAPSPEGFDAYEILTERIDFVVRSVLPASATAELRPPLGPLDLPTETSATTGWGAVIVGISLIAIAAGVYLLSRRFARRSRRRNAYDLARQQVDRLVADRFAPVPTLSLDAFYVEISRVIRQYLENRFEVRAPELTTDEFLQLAAAESELSSAHQLLLAEFLNQADMVKFASGYYAVAPASETQVRRACELAIQFLEETRENAPDVEVGDQEEVLPSDRNPSATAVEDAARV